MTCVILQNMRYPAQHKAETHAKILTVAARTFRERGAEGNGIGSVMKKIGLTKGGFYRHFESRDQLYVEAVEQAFSEMAEGMVSVAEAAPKGQQLKAMIERYLSVDHLNTPGSGCVFSTLGADMARQPIAIRKQINQSMQAYRDRLLPYMPGRTAEEKTEYFSLLYSSMVGVLITVRTIADKHAQERMLASARDFFVRNFARPRGI